MFIIGKIYITSDLHLGHSNIIKMCNRPFESVEEMDKTIIENWNKVVKDEDLVYVIGDFCFKGNNAEHYLNQLNGSIILIKGNHDKYIKHEKILKIKDYYELNYNGEKYVMSHYPIISWNGMYRDSVLFYGHIHSTGKEFEKVKNTNAYNVNCEFWDYTPQPIDKFIIHNFAESMKGKK